MDTCTPQDDHKQPGACACLLAKWRFARFRSDILVPLRAWTLAIVMAVMGATFGTAFVDHETQHVHDRSFVATLGSFDSMFYEQIVVSGYFQSANHDRNVVFFPLYPLLGWLCARTFGLAPRTALLTVSLLADALALIWLNKYLRVRAPLMLGSAQREHVLLLTAIYPTSLFFITAHTESLFLLETVGALYQLSRGKRTVAVLLIAAATATRSVGVALFLPWIACEWRSTASFKVLLLRLTFLGPACFGGLAAYMAYLYFWKDDPLAFATTMPRWLNRPPISFDQYFWALLTLEPLRSPYIPANAAYWMRHDETLIPLFSMQFANAFYFVAAILAAFYGALRRWLTEPELLACAGLLGIPYVLQSYGSALQSHGRYAAVVFPIYIVIAVVLSKMPRSAATIVYGTCATMFFIYMALMASGLKVV